jgi:hypothetical protein
MRFKIIFILFNVVIVVSFLAIYLMPLIILDFDYAKAFWSRNWGLPLLFLAIIGLLNTYFILNWKLFTLLEREDWPALITHLEHRIYVRKLIIGQQVKILSNAYLVRSDVEAIGRLENFIREQKPKILPKFALVFGIPHLLRNDPSEMIGYFSQFTHLGGNEGAWIRWNYAFALILNGDTLEAQTALSKLCAEKLEPVLTLLVIYLLHSLKPEEGKIGLIEEKRTKLRERFTRARWHNEIERSKGSIQVVVLQKLIEEATEWLFSESDRVRVH